MCSCNEQQLAETSYLPSGDPIYIARTPQCTIASTEAEKQNGKRNNKERDARTASIEWAVLNA